MIAPPPSRDGLRDSTEPVREYRWPDGSEADEVSLWLEPGEALPPPGAAEWRWRGNALWRPISTHPAAQEASSGGS